MSKIIKNTVIGTFFKEYTRFAQLQVVTAVAVFAAILDAMDTALFEVAHDADDDLNKLGKELKKAFTAIIPVYLNIQAKAFSKEILEIPETAWSVKGAIATCNAYVFKVSETNGEITLDVGNTLTMMRTVAMYIAKTQGRQAMFDLFHGEDAVTSYSKARTEYENMLSARKEQSSKDTNSTSDTESPDDSPDGTSVQTASISDKTLETSFTDLGHALANAELSKGQCGAIANMINEVTTHVQSLAVVEETETPSSAETAPKVSNKAESRKAASK